MPIEIGESSWPVVYIQAIGAGTDEDIDAYIEVLQRSLDRKERHAVIVDASRGKTMASRHRRRLAEWNRKNANMLTAYRAGLILVTTSPFVRGIIRTVYWLARPPFPYLISESLDSAKADALRLLLGEESDLNATPVDNE